MAIINNDLNPVAFRKNFSYARTVPTFVSVNIGGSDEIARWVLDRNDILYIDRAHAPHLAIKPINRLVGNNNPANGQVLIMTDALLYKADSIIRYFEQRGPKTTRLLPTDSEKRKEVIHWYNLFIDNLEDLATEYVLSLLLPNKKFANKLFKQRVPFKEKLLCGIGYPFIRKAIEKERNIKSNTPAERLFEIKKIFAQVDALLSDNRRYLTGNEFTLADLTFAAVAAPLILPVEFGGVVANINEVPDELRKAIIELRATAAGQFVLRIYREERPTARSQSQVPKKPGMLKRGLHRIVISLTAKQSGLFYFLQKNYPVLKISLAHLATVNKNDLLVDMLSRDEDFTIEEINSKKMANQKGAFFLGMDRMDPGFDRERNFARKAARRDDLEMIRVFVEASAEEIVNDALPYGKLDVAASLNHPVLIRLLDYYFGVPSPSEPKMKEWCSRLFYDLFLNLTNNKAKHQLAVDAAQERKLWILALIKDRRQDLKDGKTLPDNLLNRMILMQREPGNEWVSDDVLQRSIGGLLTGILETTSKAVVLALDELLRQPRPLGEAIEIARERDTKRMYGYVSEALRFNPVQPGVIRYSETKQTLMRKNGKTYTIPAKTKVFALTAAAMFDPEAFPEPKQFKGDRPSTYMNYGFGLHECYGKYINSVTIPTLVAAVLRLPNVRRNPGSTGRGSGLHENSFPNNFVVQFDPKKIDMPNA